MGQAPDRLKAALADRYALEREIGSGGMATVYLAEDLKHRRKVALKVLHPDLAAVLGTERFLREIEIIAGLRHPYIVPLHDSGQAAGILYYVMPYVDGSSLRERLDREGPVSPEDALKFAGEVAEALEYAHGRGILHRDIKPENILIAGGHALVTDFGIARALDVARNSRLTVTGVAVGSPLYMSPEQAVGEDLDARSDVYALACVFYEMLAGVPAFGGQNRQAILANKLSEAAPGPRIPGETVPEIWQSAVARALHKTPADRYATPLKFVAALRSDHEESESATPSDNQPPTRTRAPWRGLAAVSRRRVLIAAFLLVALVIVPLSGRTPLLGFENRDWIVVADFDDGGVQPEIARALTLALDVGLQQSTYVNVLPRSGVDNVLRLMNRPLDAKLDDIVGREVSQRAGLKGLLIPELGKVGDFYLLTLRLIDPSDGTVVASFEERATSQNDLLRALDELLAELRQGLGESLRGIKADRQLLPQVTTASMEALTRFAEGRNAWAAGLHDDAVTLFQEAVAIDPDFASAHAALANSYASFVFHEVEKARYHYDQAFSRLDRISLREQYYIQAQYHSHFGRVEEATRYFQLHIARYPDDVAARRGLAGVYQTRADCRRAIAQYAEVIRIDPRDFGALINTATCYATETRNDSALAFYDSAFAVRPERVLDSNLNHEYGITLMKVGRPEDARRVFERRLGHISANERGSAHRSLAQLALFQGRFRDAADRLEQAALLHVEAAEPGSAARDRLWLANARLIAGDSSAAASVLDQALTEVPDGAGWLWLRARIAVSNVALGRLDAARRILADLERAASAADELEGTRIDRLILEAHVLVAAGDPQSALAALEPLRAQEDLKALRYDVAEAFAHAYEAAGRRSDVERMLQTALDQQSLGLEGLIPWIMAHHRLGRIFEETGRPADAVAAYARFVEIWENADPELQPLVTDTRERIARLTSQ